MGTGCLSGTAQSLESDYQRGLRDIVPCRMESGLGAVRSLSTCVAHVVPVLEVRHEADSEQSSMVQSWNLGSLES